MKVISKIITASLDLLILTQKCDTLDTFVGPGVIECNSGQCQFSGGRAGMFGCNDPCHTNTRSHMYDYSFREVSDVSGVQSYNGKLCNFKYAKNIDSYYPDQYIEIKKGCTAKCSGCEFAPTILFRKSYENEIARHYHLNTSRHQFANSNQHTLLCPELL